MRAYPLNSPETATPIVLLVALANGNACPAEFEALDKLDAAREFNVAPDQVPCILQSLCEDMHMGAYAGDCAPLHVDDVILASILGEIDDPALQEKVIGLALAAAHADHSLDVYESRILDAVRNQWGLRPFSAPDESDDVALRQQVMGIVDAYDARIRAGRRRCRSHEGA